MGALGSVTVIFDCLGAIFLPVLSFGAAFPALGEVDAAMILLRDGPLMDTRFVLGCLSSALVGDRGRFFAATIFFPAVAFGRIGAFFDTLPDRSPGLNLWANIFL